MKIPRRVFLKRAAAAGAAAAILGYGDWFTFAGNFLEPLQVGNPFENYPNRGWESIYRDQYKYDSTFTFICAPNDTHSCRLRAYVRNGIIVRTEQAYDVSEYQDLYGNKANAGWHPRGCLKGYTLARRIYSPYRIKYPRVRAGWKEWVDAGFPDSTSSENRQRFFRRGEDDWVKVSWDEAFTLVAKTMLYQMKTYGGTEGAALLRAEGYPEEMIETMHGSGAQVMKIRAGMPLGGVIRIHSLYRFANMLALYDGKYGARGWTNYDWHGDLPPGHPMVTGVQTFDPDHNDMRHTRLFILMGVNLVENKMADSHWWIETMERGGKIVCIAPEYSPASQKADYWIPVRPGTDGALILGVTNLIIQKQLYNVDFVKRFTDFPLLVRLDNLKLLQAKDIVQGYQNATLTGYSVKVQKIPPELREKWGDYVVWDKNSNSPKPVTREDVGEHLGEKKLDPALEGNFAVNLVDGTKVEVKTVFQLYRELTSEYDPATTAEITGAPQELIERLAQDIGTIRPVGIHTGEGINHYFHCDLTTRGVFLWLALTGNIGIPGGNVAHWAGNYKSAIFDGLPTWNAEDPFNPALDPDVDGRDIKVKKYFKSENIAYWNYEDRPLIISDRNTGERVVLTGNSHMPTPTKTIWTANSNNLNNAKWAYNMIANVDPHVEMVIVNDWEWTGSCEYADVVFPVQSWVELTLPEMTGSCSNPFLQVWKGGISPLYDSKYDAEVCAGIADKLSTLTSDERYRNYWKFILEKRSEVYMQRVLDSSSTTRGYRADELLKSEKGWLMMFRTYPRIPGWEQIHESKPFYNKTGRLEFYRDEDEFIRYGENLIVYREPVEATPYLPNVIVSSHPAVRPYDFGIPDDATSAEDRQARNRKLPWSTVKGTENFLWKNGFRFYCLTPKTRHSVHSSWMVVDWNQLWSSNFGDPYRSDKRSPGLGDHQINMNPEDAKELGISDGDYVWVDANPEDRPYKGWKPTDELYKVSRCMLRAKYNPAYPRGVIMVKHAPFMATHKSVRAHESRPDGRALSEDTGYQSNMRYGSHQSLTRGWLQPTMMTDSLVRKAYYGQTIGEGYEPDIHSPNTCPKETLVRISKAESGGPAGIGVWEPATTGLTPGNENDSMRQYMKGGFIKVTE